VEARLEALEGPQSCVFIERGLSSQVERLFSLREVLIKQLLNISWSQKASFLCASWTEERESDRRIRISEGLLLREGHKLSYSPPWEVEIHLDSTMIWI
jgi:hypothetical protein